MGDLREFQIRIIHLKDRFTTPTSGGWADAMVNFSFAHGDDTHLVMELQIQHAQMLVVRKEGKAHAQYNSFRSAFELLEAVERQPHDVFNDLQEDIPMVQKLQQQMASMQQQQHKQQIDSMQQQMASMQQQQQHKQQIDSMQQQ